MNYQQQLQSPKWQQKRLEIMQRDKFHCQACDSDEKQLTVHHYKYRKNAMAWEYDDSMLVTLCSDCHKKIHNIQDYFKVDFVRFKPKCGMFSFESIPSYIFDCRHAFSKRYKNIYDAFDDYNEYGALAFDSENFNRTYIFNNVEFDIENDIIWVNSFFDAK